MTSILLITPVTDSSVEGVSQVFLREYYMPLALLYLSGSLARNFEVRVLDLNTLQPWELDPAAAERIMTEAVRKALEETRPGLVGLNCMFSAQMDRVMKLAAQVKEFDPSIKVATGGMHPTLFGRQMLEHCPSLDFVLKGEGEENTLALALALKEGRGVQNIDGLTYRTADGRVAENPKTSYIHDPDSIPRPAYHLFDFKGYAIDTSRWHNPRRHNIGVPVPLVTSRSCPQRCNFCALFHAMGPRFRARSAAHVLDEMEYLYHEHQTRYFEIMDDNFSLNRKRTLEICRGIIDRKMDIQFRTVSGLFINSLDQECVDALAEAGLVWAPIAIESGSDFIRNKVIGKNLSRKKIFEIVKAFGRHPQIILTTFFIFGLPEETPKTIMETLDLMRELEVDDRSTCNAIPFPGTALHAQCVKENLLINNSGDWNDKSLFATNQGQNFFLKPHALSLDELTSYRAMIDQLRLEKMSQKYKNISRTAWAAETAAA